MNVSVYRRALGATAGFVDGSRGVSDRVGGQRPVAGLRITTTCITDLDTLESALVNTPLRDWRRLAEEAPHASLFQSPGWCMPWYRAYQRSFSPLVIVVTAGEELVGVVPMAIERSTGVFAFASNTAADYRDIVARAGYRRQVLAALFAVYLAGRFPNPLQIGWLDPASDTQALVQELCRERGLSCIVGQQPCYRWYPPAPAKPSAHKFLNWYKRQGAVSFDVIETHEDWQSFRDEFYRQHSLRQLQAGRERLFDDPERATFYEQLFDSPGLRHQISRFTLDGTMLAGHFGYVWKDVLLLGPPSIRLHDEQRSPAVILFAWIIQNAGTLGLRGFDLTIGDTDFKKRLGNQCVEVTTIDVYASRRAYALRRARTAVITAAKWIVARLFGEDAWRGKVKPLTERLSYKKARLAEEGIVPALRAGVRAALTAIAESRQGNVYAMTPDEVQPVAARIRPEEQLEFHQNTVEDLLLWEGSSLTTASAISACARSFSRVLHAKGTLHTVVIDGRLAGWGHSFYPTGPAQLTETPGAVLELPSGAVSLYDFHVVPEFRGRRIYQALLTHILQQRFTEGASRAYITVLASNTASRVAIERVGFRRVAVNHYRRVLKWQHIRQGA